jgi:hypothetical protein
MEQKGDYYTSVEPPAALQVEPNLLWDGDLRKTRFLAKKFPYTQGSFNGQNYEQSLNVIHHKLDEINSRLAATPMQSG